MGVVCRRRGPLPGKPLPRPCSSWIQLLPPVLCSLLLPGEHPCCDPGPPPCQSPLLSGLGTGSVRTLGNAFFPGWFACGLPTIIYHYTDPYQ